MPDTFQVGEIAILQNCTRCTEDNGDECEIVGLPRAKSWTNPRSFNLISPGYYVISHRGKDWQVRPDQLRKKTGPPPPAREQVGEWELCPWQPAQGKTTALSEVEQHG